MKPLGSSAIWAGLLLICDLGCRAAWVVHDGGGGDGGAARDAGLALVDGGAGVDAGPGDGAAGMDGGLSLDGGDGGLVFTLEEDPTCACGVMGRARSNGGQISVRACPCFAIPAVVFDCEHDSDCVTFVSTCEGCRSFPAISVNRIWSACVEEYKRQYCGRYEQWGTGASSCCSGCTAHGDPPCQPRCVNHRCFVDAPHIPGFNDECVVYRDPDGGFFVNPYPYPVDGGPHAQCGD